MHEPWDECPAARYYERVWLPYKFPPEACAEIQKFTRKLFFYDAVKIVVGRRWEGRIFCSRLILSRVMMMTDWISQHRRNAIFCHLETVYPLFSIHRLSKYLSIDLPRLFGKDD